MNYGNSNFMGTHTNQADIEGYVSRISLMKPRKDDNERIMYVRICHIHTYAVKKKESTVAEWRTENWYFNLSLYKTQLQWAIATGMSVSDYVLFYAAICPQNNSDALYLMVNDFRYIGRYAAYKYDRARLAKVTEWLNTEAPAFADMKGPRYIDRYSNEGINDEKDEKETSKKEPL